MQRSLVLLLILLWKLSLAQTDPSVSTTLVKTFLPVSMKLDNNDPIFNGKEHAGYLYSIEGIAYHTSNEWQNGSIIYRGVLYPEIPLKFDLVSNEVIIRHYNGYTAIALFSPRIRSFSFLNKNFVFLGSDETAGQIPPGIYEKLSNGRVSLYAFRSKEIEENIKHTQLTRRFKDIDRYYVFKDGKWIRIQGRNDILNLLKDKKAEIKSFLKEKQINYKADPELTLTKIVEFYNHQLSR